MENALKVVVAMSGGVDSAAAAIFLKEKGYEVIGVSMQVWDYRKNGGNSKRATCCAPADFEDARDVSRVGDFPFYVFDFEDSFEEAVINPFVNSYLRGETPNPCVDCNRKIKFKELRKRAKALGADKVATGHYAQIKELSDGKLGLFTSVDRDKDQSYFLYAITQEELRETIFPVGHLRKPQVREFLDNRGIRVAQKAESQDICFVSSSVSEFIEKKGKVRGSSGVIRDLQGEKLGEHSGLHQFTVGQRKGIISGAKHPLYVLQIEPKTNELVVGSEAELERKDFLAREINWISGNKPGPDIEVTAKLRYRGTPVLCKVSMLDEPRLEGSGLDDTAARITFLDKWVPVSPGQAVVFYSATPDSEGDYLVLGGGTISREQ